MRNVLRVTGMALLGLVGIVCPSSFPNAAAQECSQGCVPTYGYDYSRDNANPSETYFKASILGTTQNPTYTNSPDLNGVVYAQPLYVSQVSIGGVLKNALFVATEENYVYALDGDTISNNPLWTANLNFGDTAVPDSKLPNSCANISPEVGITGTPVIDTATNVLYVVTKRYNQSSNTVSQWLNVLNLSDGSAAAPALNIGTALGSGFSPVNENQRAGLALVSQGATPGGPQVYVAWGSHCDASNSGSPAYTGWVGAFHFVPGNPGVLTLSQTFQDEDSSGTKGGIWMSGGAPALSVAPEGSTAIADVYLATGNGSWNGSSEFGESVLRLHHGSDNTIALTGFYTPNAWSILNHPIPNCTLNMPPPYAPGTTICSSGDFDLGSGSVILARPVGSGYLFANDRFVALAAGKEGVFYVLDPSSSTFSNAGQIADTTDPCTQDTAGQQNTGQTIQCFGAIQLPSGCCNSLRDYGSRGSNAFWAGSTMFQENVAVCCW